MKPKMKSCPTVDINESTENNAKYLLRMLENIEHSTCKHEIPYQLETEVK